MKQKKKKIVIVGGGIGGMTAAAYLVKNNHDVIIIEKNSRIGGLLGAITKDGFHFDTGARALVNSGMVRPIFRDLGIDLEYFENKITISIEDEIFRVDSMDSLKEYEEILKRLFPENIKDIEILTSEIYDISIDTEIQYRLDNPNFMDIFGDIPALFKEIIPWLFTFLGTVYRMNRTSGPMESFFSKFTENQSLINMLSQFFFKSTPAFFAMGYFYVYLDYFYPKGGTGSLVQLLKDKYTELGGTIMLNTRITEVSASESVLTDSEGNKYEYDKLIWAADLNALYSQISTDGLSTGKIKKLSRERDRMLAAKGGESVFCMFMGVDRPPSYFQENGGEHLFYTPDRTGLGEINRSQLQDIIENFSSKSKNEILDWIDRFCDFNTYEVSVPVLRDSSLAPEGKTGLMISVLFDYKLAAKIEQAGWHDEFKERMENRIIGLFSKSRYKDLNDDLLFRFSSSPLTIQSVSGNSDGAITGWSFEAPVPVQTKILSVNKSVQTPLPDILQCGQWTFSPSGVPLAMLTGWYAAKKIGHG